MSHTIYINTHTRTITHPYKYIYAYPISMNTSKRLDQFDLKIHETDQKH
jgi:hypothetical protein